MNKFKVQIASVRSMFLPFMVCAFVMANVTLTWALERAPLNPEFLKYREQLKAKTLVTRAAGGRGLGHIPHPAKLPRSAVPLPRSKPKATPPSYDLRDYGKVSSVQDQGNYGNCWTFATFGSMESCLLPGESWNFSENNLANLHGLDSGYGEGGNYYMSLAYLGRWSGPVLESDDPYSNGPNSPTSLTVRKHVQNAWFIPDRTSATDNNTIKSIIMTYGGFYSAFYWSDSYYNTANYAYYCSSADSGNHAITIVGWDDSFSRTKFNTTPPGDGAFLIKNSWGTSWGNAGYGWISYYDARIGKDNCLFLDAASTSNYASVYQYDNLGYCTSYGAGGTTGYGANIFSGDAGTIQAVSFYLGADSASYEVKVYTGVTAGNPISGTLSATKSGTAAYAGYYTVVLDTPVSYTTRFSVVVKFTTPGSEYPIPVEYPISDYSSAATASAGESYVSSDGNSWSEAKDSGVYFNVCIKAFGTGGGQAPTPPSYSGTPLLGDYDGDRYGDPVFYRSSGVWNILFSSQDYGYFSFQYGGSGYEAKSADFDADGLQDPTVYEESTGYWYMILSSDSYNRYYIEQPWGASGYTMLSGDYDGDRYADPMAYREASGYWYILASRYDYDGIYYYINWWGGSGYTPVTGDFDGDRYSDLMAYHRTSGTWFILLSSTGDTYWYQIDNFGGSGYTPVVGDFDGDRYADPVAFHDSTFTWNILLSSSGWTYYISPVWNGSSP